MKLRLILIYGIVLAQTYRFDIPAGSLQAALDTFQSIAGVNIAADPAIIRDLSTPGVQGVYSAEQALDRLLAGTGLSARLTSAGSFSIDVRIAGENVEVTAQSSPYAPGHATTATKTLTPLRDIPQTLNVIPRELLLDQHAQSVAEAMKNVPGVSVAQGEGNRDQVVLRGISTSSDFFVNGVRDDQERFRDLYNVESIEVLQGPAAVLFGRGGGGGVVNLVTRGPLTGGVSDVTLELGAYNHKRGTVQYGSSLGSRAGFRFSAMGERSGGFREGYFLHRYGVNPTLGVVLGTSTTVSIGYEHLNDRRLADRGIPSDDGRPLNVRPGQFFGSLSQNTASSGVDSLSASVQHQINRSLSIANHLLVARYGKFYRNVYPGSSVNAVGAFTLSGYDHRLDRTNVFTQTELTYYTRAAGIDHTILFGLEAGHQFQDEWRHTAASITNVPVAASVRDADFGAAPLAIDRHASSSVLAGYVQDQMTLAEQWKAVAGARVDRFGVSVADHRAGAPDLSRLDTAASPRVGLIYQPSDAVSLYSSYSSTFLPSGQTLGLAVNTAQVSPENAKNYEIGAKLELLRDRLNVSAALFRLDRNNVKNTDPNDPAKLVLTGRQRNDGLTISAGGSLNARWIFSGGYAFLNARVTQATAAAPAGRRVGLVPRSQFTMWSTYDLSRRWGTGGGIVSQAAAFTSFTNEVTLPGFARADAVVYYRMGRYRLALNAENVFNAKYYPTANGDNNISPGSPRNVQLSLRAAF